MSESLRKHSSLLRLLHRSSPKLRRALIKKNCNGEFIRCISNCCANILKCNVPLNRAQLLKLRRKRHIVRKLADTKTSIAVKKRIIQKGGFLGLILPPLVGALGSLCGGLIGSRG